MCTDVVGGKADWNILTALFIDCTIAFYEIPLHLIIAQAEIKSFIKSKIHARMLWKKMCSDSFSNQSETTIKVKIPLHLIIAQVRRKLKNISNLVLMTKIIGNTSDYLRM